MATWVRLGTGTAPTAFNLDLVGDYALDNATAPADFDPAAVSSVRTQWTITGSGFVDDSWDNVAGVAVETGATEISQHPAEGSTANQNVARASDHTDSTGIPTGLSVAQWEAALVRGDGTVIPDEWCLWNKVKAADGSTLTVSVLTVTITYTPSSGSNFTREATDPENLLDSATQAAESVRSETDPLGLVDSESQVFTGDRSQSDPEGLADDGTADRTRPYDALGLTDDATYDHQTGGGIGRTVTDVEGLTDTASAVLDISQTLTESLGLADAQTLVQDHRPTQTDTSGLTDDASSQSVAERAQTDSLGLTDTATGVGDYPRSQTDALGLIDAVSYDHQTAGEVVVTDPLGLTDATEVSGDKNLEEIDPIGLTDSVQAGLLIEVSITDLIGAVDTAVRAGGYQPTVTDAQGLVDAVSRSVDFIRAHDDVLGLVDDVLAEGIDQPLWFIEAGGVVSTSIEFASRGDLIETN